MKTKDSAFWDQAWASSENSEEVKLIDLVMHKTAVDFTYGILGDIKNKKLLEIGCGCGAQTIDFIRKGAIVTAIDISEESVSVTKEFLRENRLRAVVEQVNAEQMPFPDHSFDIVYINCVLMHAHQDKTIRESLRVLKKNGMLIFKETLKQWIASCPYRLFSPYMKAKPHYLSLTTVRRWKAKHREFYLFGSFFAVLFYLFEDQALASRLFSLFGPMDSFLLKRLPWLRTFAWVTIGTIRKM